VQINNDDDDIMMWTGCSVYTLAFSLRYRHILVSHCDAGTM